MDWMALHRGLLAHVRSMPQLSHLRVLAFLRPSCRLFLRLIAISSLLLPFALLRDLVFSGFKFRRYMALLLRDRRYRAELGKRLHRALWYTWLSTAMASILRVALTAAANHLLRYRLFPSTKRPLTRLQAASLRALWDALLLLLSHPLAVVAARLTLASFVLPARETRHFFVSEIACPRFDRRVSFSHPPALDFFKELFKIPHYAQFFKTPAFLWQLCVAFSSTFLVSFFSSPRRHRYLSHALFPTNHSLLPSILSHLCFFLPLLNLRDLLSTFPRYSSRYASGFSLSSLVAHPSASLSSLLTSLSSHRPLLSLALLSVVTLPVSYVRDLFLQRLLVSCFSERFPPPQLPEHEQQLEPHPDENELL